MDKHGKPANYDVFEKAWQALFQRFENTLKGGNFPGAFKADHGLLLTDATKGVKLKRMVRRMAVFNYIPSKYFFGTYNAPILRVIEDPHPKDSADSYFIQCVDVAAYFLHQRYKPNSFIRRSNATKYFDRLKPVLNLKACNNRLGIVVL